MISPLLNRPATVTLFGKRSRQDLVEMLVRAHRNNDRAMVETCRAELDRRSLECRQFGRPMAVARH